MEIKTLVIIGVLCILVSTLLFFYLNLGDLMDRIREFKRDMLFAEETKQDLKFIDKAIDQELAKADKDKNVEEKRKALDDLEKVKRELDSLKSQLADNKNVSQGNEVFLVRNNIFSQDQAPKVCKALFNSSVATKDQLQDSYNNGANWCNYGWTKEEDQAYYTLQEDSNKSFCGGKKGLNGGLLDDNNNYKLGIHCFGKKPSELEYSSLEKIYQDSSLSENDIALLEEYRKKMNVGGIKIAPFNNKNWSQYSYKLDTMKIGDTTVVTSSKESAKDPQSTKVPASKVEGFINSA